MPKFMRTAVHIFLDICHLRRYLIMLPGLWVTIRKIMLMLHCNRLSGDIVVFNLIVLFIYCFTYNLSTQRLVLVPPQQSYMYGIQMR